MNPSDPPNSEAGPLQSWLECKRALRPSGHLSGSVMAALEGLRAQDPAPRPGEALDLPWWRELFRTSWAPAAVLVLAAVGGFGRVLLMWVWLLWT